MGRALYFSTGGTAKAGNAVVWVVQCRREYNIRPILAAADAR